MRLNMSNAYSVLNTSFLPLYHSVCMLFSSLFLGFTSSYSNHLLSLYQLQFLDTCAFLIVSHTRICINPNFLPRFSLVLDSTSPAMLPGFYPESCPVVTGFDLFLHSEFRIACNNFWILIQIFGKTQNKTLYNGNYDQPHHVPCALQKTLLHMNKATLLQQQHDSEAQTTKSTVSLTLSLCFGGLFKIERMSLFQPCLPMALSCHPWLSGDPGLSILQATKPSWCLALWSGKS